MKNITIPVLAFALGLIVMYFLQQQYIILAKKDTKTLLGITRKMENSDNNLINEDDKLIEYVGNCLFTTSNTLKACDIDKAAVMAYNHHSDRLNLPKDRQVMDDELIRIEKNN